jgi:hypothetical protein
MKDAALPIEKLQEPGAFRLPSQLIRELAHRVIHCIQVWPMKVRVMLKNGEQFEVERCKIHNSRVLPHWRARIHGPVVGRETRVDVVYFYKSCRQYLRYGKLPVNVIYQGRGLRVMTMGMNDVSQKVELRRQHWRDAWQSAEYSRIEVGGGSGDGGKAVEVQLDLQG